MQKLSNATAGRHIVKWIFTEPEIREHLKSIQIEEGRGVTVLSNIRSGGLLLRSDAGSFYVDCESLAGITV